MKAICILFFVWCSSINAAPTDSAQEAGCSPIIPPDSCGGAPWTRDVAVHLLINTINPKLVSILDTVSRMSNESTLASISEYDDGPYRLDNRSSCSSSSDSAACIARSVYRLKCYVPIVADIVKNESLRQLVSEESNFAPEFQSILGDLDVLLDLKELVSRHRPISECQVEENTCAKLIYAERLKTIKSSVEDLLRLVDDLNEAINDFFQK